MGNRNSRWSQIEPKNKKKSGKGKSTASLPIVVPKEREDELPDPPPEQTRYEVQQPRARISRGQRQVSPGARLRGLPILQIGLVLCCLPLIVILVATTINTVDFLFTPHGKIAAVVMTLVLFLLMRKKIFP